MVTRWNQSYLDVLANPTQQFCGQEHRQIFERTKHIPGWHAEGDAFKLFELGYFAGDVILEIGVPSEQCIGPQARMGDRALAKCREDLMARYQLAPDSQDGPASGHER